MTLSININSGSSAQGGLGVGLMTSAGNPWAVADALAQELVNRGVATAVNWPAASGQPLTPAVLAALPALVSGARIADATSRSITKDDNGAFLAPTAALIYTIPAALSPRPSFTVDCPAAGAVTVAVSGGATINGAATFLTRTRAANPVGFVVLSHEADAYGVSGV